MKTAEEKVKKVEENMLLYIERQAFSFFGQEIIRIDLVGIELYSSD